MVNEPGLPLLSTIAVDDVLSPQSIVAVKLEARAPASLTKVPRRVLERRPANTSIVFATTVGAGGETTSMIAVTGGAALAALRIVTVTVNEPVRAYAWAPG